ncbi:cytochrome d ubiquinol oxidase subunit II [Brockia lithotrophica]|uniref:Cytochrome bd-I ubiquinol oxidase subunit 2 apoprotein n=1 Tax=Brockia lithotrophica TaxID=933949 RepID=A0A660KXY8_9BACL|nr:cytochrome d ubiquinol oxidase subunit II [Brockia lithotrophica]RKQ85499.1 cytochrome bd-I ubiquinol oxidase subunit 2 apoprotein [Brockia lithotrophica]
MPEQALPVIWYVLWVVLWVVYFVLDSKTLGLGTLFPFLARNEREEAALQEAVGPFWDGDEVWLITAGGATFAAFPLTYAVMFSALYVPFFLLLFALFYRAVGLEFMSKVKDPGWHNAWRWAFTVASFLVILLLGVAFANLFYGLDFDASGNKTTLFTLLNPYGILGGLTFVTLALLSGTIWGAFKVSGELEKRLEGYAHTLWVVALALFSIYMVATANRASHLLANYNQVPVLYVIPALALLLLLLVKPLLSRGAQLGAWLATSGTIALLLVTGFVGLFPNMLYSRTAPEASITAYQAAASPLTQTVMLGVALALVPVVIGYQFWAYKKFSERKIDVEEAKGYGA